MTDICPSYFIIKTVPFLFCLTFELLFGYFLLNVIIWLLFFLFYFGLLFLPILFVQLIS